jgi:hypothetical protein
VLVHTLGLLQQFIVAQVMALCKQHKVDPEVLSSFGDKFSYLGKQAARDDVIQWQGRCAFESRYKELIQFVIQARVLGVPAVQPPKSDLNVIKNVVQWFTN